MSRTRSRTCASIVRTLAPSVGLPDSFQRFRQLINDLIAKLFHALKFLETEEPKSSGQQCKHLALMREKQERQTSRSSEGRLERGRMSQMSQMATTRDSTRPFSHEP